MPIWLYGLTVGRYLNKGHNAEESDEFEEEELVAVETDSSSGAGGKHTPSTGSVDDDFELLDKSVEDVSASAKTSGSQPQTGKNNKRKNKGKKR